MDIFAYFKFYWYCLVDIDTKKTQDLLLDEKSNSYAAILLTPVFLWFITLALHYSVDEDWTRYLFIFAGIYALLSMTDLAHRHLNALEKKRVEIIEEHEKNIKAIEEEYARKRERMLARHKEQLQKLRLEHARTKKDMHFQHLAEKDHVTK